jgi:hypothetical protein
LTSASKRIILAHMSAYASATASRARGDAATVIREIWFAPDSPVEEAGFEPSVPGKRDRTIDTVSAFYVIARTAMTPWPWLDPVGSSRQIQAADN